MSTGSVLSRLVAGPFVRPGAPEARREEAVPRAPPLVPVAVPRPAMSAASEEEGAGLLHRPQRPQAEAMDPAPTPREEPVARQRPAPEEPPVPRAARPSPAPATPPGDTPRVPPAGSEPAAAPANRPFRVAQPPAGPTARLAVPPLVPRARLREREEERTVARGPLQAAPPVETRPERPSRLATPPLAPVRAPETRTPPAPRRTETLPERPSVRDHATGSSERGSADRGNAPRVATPPAPVSAPLPDKPLPPRERPSESLRAAEREDRSAPRCVVGPSAVEPKEERTSPARQPGDGTALARPRLLLPPAERRPLEKGAPSAHAPAAAPLPRARVESKRAAQGPQPRPGVPGGGRGRASVHPPERFASASSDRSRQAGRPAVSIAIGTLEIRERTAPAAQPLPAVAPRSHEIDPGFTLGGLAPGRW